MSCMNTLTYMQILDFFKLTNVNVNLKVKMESL